MSSRDIDLFDRTPDGDEGPSEPDLPEAIRLVRGEPATGIFVGPISGSEAFGAIVAAQKEAMAFVCDGRSLLPSSRGIAEWFRGARSGAAPIDLRSEGGAHLQATVGRDGARGTVTIGRRSFELSLPPASGDAGLYRVETTISGDDVVAGWILLEDDSMRGSATVRSAQDCQNLATALNRLLVKKVTSGTDTLADLDARIAIRKKLSELEC